MVYIIVSYHNSIASQTSISTGKTTLILHIYKRWKIRVLLCYTLLKCVWFVVKNPLSTIQIVSSIFRHVI